MEYYILLKRITLLSIYVTVSFANTTLLIILPYILHIDTIIISHFKKEIHSRASYRREILISRELTLETLQYICGYSSLPSHNIVNNGHHLLIFFHIHKFPPIFVIIPTTHHTYLHRCPHFSHHLSLDVIKHHHNFIIIIPLWKKFWAIFDFGRWYDILGG